MMQGRGQTVSWLLAVRIDEGQTDFFAGGFGRHGEHHLKLVGPCLFWRGEIPFKRQ